MGISRSFNTNSNNQVSIDKKQLNNRNDQYVDDMSDDEYEEGEVSGFMVQRPLIHNGITTNNIQTVVPMEKTGYQYGPTGQQDVSYNNYHPTPMYGGGSEMKTVNLKDIFEIALTTLAFLSFGMFIVQVIMCISMAKSSEQTVMLPMEMTADGGEVEAAELEVRVKRSVDRFDPNIQQINEISRRALQSFEAFVIARHDNGQCLKRFICENNKFSRKTVDLQKYLIPILGLGLSWMSNKVTNQPITANLDNLQASIIGLGNGNCTRFKCDIKFLNQMRK